MVKTFRAYMAGGVVAFSSLFGFGASANAQQMAMSNDNDVAVKLADDGGNGAPLAVQASPKEMFGNANKVTIVSVGNVSGSESGNISFVSIGGKFGNTNLNAKELEAKVKASKDGGTFDRDQPTYIEFSVIEESRFNGLSEMLKPGIDSGELEVTIFELPIKASNIERQGGNNYSVTGSNLQPIDKLPTPFAALAKTETAKTDSQTTTVGMAKDDAGNANAATVTQTQTQITGPVVAADTAAVQSGLVANAGLESPVENAVAASTAPVAEPGAVKPASADNPNPHNYPIDANGNYIIGHDSNGKPITSNTSSAVLNDPGLGTSLAPESAQQNQKPTDANKPTIFDGDFSGQILVAKSGKAWVITNSTEFPIGSIVNDESYVPSSESPNTSDLLRNESAKITDSSYVYRLFSRDTSTFILFQYETGDQALAMAKWVKSEIEGGQIVNVGTFSANSSWNVERLDANKIQVQIYNTELVSKSNLQSSITDVNDVVTDLIGALSSKQVVASNSVAQAGVQTSSDGSMVAGDALGIALHNANQSNAANASPVGSTESRTNAEATSITNVGMEPPVDAAPPSNSQPEPAAQPANESVATPADATTPNVAANSAANDSAPLAAVNATVAPTTPAQQANLQQPNDVVKTPPVVDAVQTAPTVSANADAAPAANANGNVHASDNSNVATTDTNPPVATNKNGINWFGWVASGVAAVLGLVSYAQKRKIAKANNDMQMILLEMKELRKAMATLVQQSGIDLNGTGYALQPDIINDGSLLLVKDSSASSKRETKTDSGLLLDKKSATVAALVVGAAGALTSVGSNTNYLSSETKTSESNAVASATGQNLSFEHSQILAKPQEFVQTIVGSFGMGKLVSNGKGCYTLLQNQLANQRQA